MADGYTDIWMPRKYLNVQWMTLLRTLILAYFVDFKYVHLVINCITFYTVSAEIELFIAKWLIQTVQIFIHYTVQNIRTQNSIFALALVEIL